MLVFVGLIVVGNEVTVDELGTGNQLVVASKLTELDCNDQPR